MKKIIFLFIALLCLSCNDGDFNVPEFDFTDDVYSCSTYVLNVASQSKTETMVMTLINGELSTEVGNKSYPITSSLEVVYRIFDESIGSDYFCQAIPPTTPKVIKELIAEGGYVNIITSEIYTQQFLTGYSYEITFSDLLFIDDGKTVFFESFEFGTYDLDL